MFEFNLLPPKSKEEIEKYIERDNTIKYSFFLILFILIVFGMISVFESIIVNQRVSGTESSIENLNEQISTFDSIKIINGELFLKSQTLEPILLKDIKIIEIIDTAVELTQGINDSRIIQYGREGTGFFTLRVEVPNVEDTYTMINNSRNIDKILNFFIKRIEKKYTGSNFEVDISFNIKPEISNG